MNKYIEFQNESFECALEKGWWDDCLTGSMLDGAKIWEVIPEKIALVHSEISEALEDFRVGKMVTTLREDGKPEGFGSELADVCIRWWDLLGAISKSSASGNLWTLSSDLDVPKLGRESPRFEGARDVPRQLAWLHWATSQCLELFSVVRAGECVIATLKLGRDLGYDMDEEIRKKQAYNRTRSYRHGGKRA